MYQYLRLLRPRHWLKNSLVGAALVFSLQTSADNFGRTALAILAFSLAASSIYILNDLVDAPADRLHPVKRKRPIASGAVSATAAGSVALLTLTGAVCVSSFLPPGFRGTLAGYGLLTVLYTFWLKRIFILDVMAIAAGFVLRVIAGGTAIAVAVSPWIVLCTFFVSLFLGFGKRKNEVDILQDGSHRHRAVLYRYTPAFLDQLLAITAGMAIMGYALYTIDTATVQHFGTQNLIYTIPFVVYGVFRYFHLMYNHTVNDDPTLLLSHDRASLVNMGGWLAAFLLIAHYG